MTSGVRARAAAAHDALGAGCERSRRLGGHRHGLGYRRGDHRLGGRGRLGGSSNRDDWLAFGRLGRRLGRRLGWRRRRQWHGRLLAPFGNLRARVYRVALVDFAGARLVIGRRLAAAARALETGFAVAAGPDAASGVRKRARRRRSARRPAKRLEPWATVLSRHAPLAAYGLEEALQAVLMVAALRLRAGFESAVQQVAA